MHEVQTVAQYWQRLHVPGGWIYQSTWGGMAAVFVPEPVVQKTPKRVRRARRRA